MSGHRGCRARPGPVIAVEVFLGEHPGRYRPDGCASALAAELDPSAVAEVVAYLVASGRAVLDDEGCLIRQGREPGSASGPCEPP